MTGPLRRQGPVIERFVILASAATHARAGDGPLPSQGTGKAVNRFLSA